MTKVLGAEMIGGVRFLNDLAALSDDPDKAKEVVEAQQARVTELFKAAKKQLDPQPKWGWKIAHSLHSEHHEPEYVRRLSIEYTNDQGQTVPLDLTNLHRDGNGNHHATPHQVSVSLQHTAEGVAEEILFSLSDKGQIDNYAMGLDADEIERIVGLFLPPA